MYLLIYCDEDGRLDFVKYEKKDSLLSDLEENHYGDIGFYDHVPDADKMCRDNRVLIIKGDVVTPKPIEVVKKYEI